MSDTRLRGTVRKFLHQKGYGFVVPEHAGGDVFVHISAFHEAGITDLDDIEGRRISFVRSVSRDGRTKATDIRLLAADE